MDFYKLEARDYQLALNIEQVEDNSYMATSPDLAGFLILADTIAELQQLAPIVAKALIEAMRASDERG